MQLEPLGGDGLAHKHEQSLEEFEALALSRFTCRAFDSAQVPRPLIERLLQVAQRTATWCNTQPWQVVVTEGDATRRFADALYAHALSGAPPHSDVPFPGPYVGRFDERRKQVGKQLYGALGIEKGDREASRRQTLENFRLFGAPHVALVTSEQALGPYGILDCGFYMGQFLLAAQAAGLATAAQAAIAMHSDFVRSYFNIPPGRLLLCGISFGYADQSQPVNNFRTGRAPLEQVAEFIS
ncbi:nitroreductase family protein [Sphingobium sp. V4]|uniref:nitroreductase family protein n=1 Tax=Sphingobium sp. V4 TaxID=3038927 RepID=UPI0025581B64|nr:nitroreductase family protein [Sphingobium sp. V4]WIW89461.1 nitroreductase family protein [Sphingobium sp. V4]